MVFYSILKKGGDEHGSEFRSGKFNIPPSDVPVIIILGICLVVAFCFIVAVAITGGIGGTWFGPGQPPSR